MVSVVYKYSRNYEEKDLIESKRPLPWRWSHASPRNNSFLSLLLPSPPFFPAA